MVDSARFPSLFACLAALPAGFDSYPECRTKGAIVRSAIDDSDLMGVVDVVPALLRERPPITNTTLIRALVDLTGGTETQCDMVEQGPTGARYVATRC